MILAPVKCEVIDLRPCKNYPTHKWRTHNRLRYSSGTIAKFSYWECVSYVCFIYQLGVPPRWSNLPKGGKVMILDWEGQNMPTIGSMCPNSEHSPYIRHTQWGVLEGAGWGTITSTKACVWKFAYICEAHKNWTCTSPVGSRTPEYDLNCSTSYVIRGQ